MKDDPMRDFIAGIDKVTNQVNELNEIVQDYLFYNPDNIHWGHVGTVENLSNQLQEILDGLKY